MKDAIALLKQDHKEVKDMLEQLSETSERAGKKRQELASKIARALQAHMEIEEQIFYPAFKAAAAKKEDQKLYYEAVEEHHAADVVCQDVLRADVTSLNFGGKAKVLKELIEHHIEEEEKTMFPHARKVMSKEILQALGIEMADMKESVMNGGLANPSKAKTNGNKAAKTRATKGKSSGRSRVAHP
ncbi:MAG TPA: hemerythrin domain-containing protein [Polyangiaceae bacterium]|nr:hemerythrin domain-containing protein [Polyangiaceae bacterium]